MTDAIKPPWAISVWANADHIYAELPAINGRESHVVKVPSNGTGILKIVALAKSRDMDSKIGTKGDPTQHQISRKNFVRSKKVPTPKRPKLSFTPEQRAGARDILRKMGLI